MRDDLAKVITERPRVGPRLKQPKGYKKAMRDIGEDSPKSEKIGFKWEKNYGDSKQFSERLGPLKRYLLSKVGQPWNDVYSELRQGLDMGNLVQKHVMTHVFDYVEIEVYLAVDGNYYTNPPYSREVSFLYVDPETGILCKVPEKSQKFRRNQKRDDIIEVNENLIYKKIDGIWYELEMAKMTSYKEKVSPSYAEAPWNYLTRWNYVFDIGHKTRFGSDHDSWRYYGKNGVYAIKKRQLSSKEIKQLAA